MTCKSCGRETTTQYARKSLSNSVGYHHFERCDACKGNARGGGVWVAKREIELMGRNPDSLPIVADSSPATRAAGGPHFLFEDL